MKKLITLAAAFVVALIAGTSLAAVPQLVWEGNSATANKTLSQAVEKGKPFTLVVQMVNTDANTTAGSYIIGKINAGQTITPFCVSTDAFTGFTTGRATPNSSLSYDEKKSGGWWLGVGSRSSGGAENWNEEKLGDPIAQLDSIYVAYSGTVDANGTVSSFSRLIYAHRKDNDSFYERSDSNVSLTIADNLDTISINSSVNTLAFKVYLDNIQRDANQMKQAIADIINPPAPPVSATVSTDIDWSKIGWDTTIEDPANTEVVLTVQNNATITLDGEFAYKAITINGNVQFVVPESMYEDGCWEKKLLTAPSFTTTGTVMFGAVKEGFYGAYSQTANGISLRAQNKKQGSDFH